MTTGFTRTSPTQVIRRIVSINGIDAATNTANGAAVDGRGPIIDLKINLAYHVGVVQVTPSIGEQWYVRRISNAEGMMWVLDAKIPNNTPEALTPATEGQQQFGNGRGPIQLHGTQINANAPLRLTSGNSPLPAASTVDAGSLAYNDQNTVPTFSDGNIWNDLATGAQVNGKYTKPTGGIPSTDLASSVQSTLAGAYQLPAGGIPTTDLSSTTQTAVNNGATAQTNWTTFLADMGVSTISQLATQLGTLTSGSNTDTVNWTTIFNDLGLGGISDFTTWLNNLFGASNTSTSNWNTLITNLEQTTAAEVATLVNDINTAASQAQANWNTTLTNLGLGTSSAFSTWLTNVETAANNAVTTGNYNGLLTALFGTTSVQSTIHVGAIPTGIPQTNISGLVTALSNAVTTGNWNTLLTMLFGGTSVGSAVQVSALPTNIPQSYISGLTAALSNAITTGNWNGLLTALFGTTTVGSSLQLSALPTNIPQSYVSGLVSALNSAVTTGNWNPLLMALFGSTAQPTNTSQIIPGAVSGLTAVWNTLFGTTAPTGTSTVQQTAITGLTSLWNTIFGTTTPTGTSLVQQSAINGLQTLWNQLFGTTTPTGTSQVQQTAISGLQAIWNQIFGTTTPTGSSQIVQAAIVDLNNIWTNLFGSGGNPKTGPVAVTALPGITIGGTSNTIPAQIQAIVDSIYQSFQGGATTGNTVASIKANLQTLFNSLFGTTTAGTQVQQTAISGLTTAWTALFGSSAAPTSGSQVLQTSVANLTNAWTALFGTSATPTISSQVLQSSVQNLSNAWIALFGAATSPTTSSQVLQTSVANLTTAWQALFGTTAVPTASSQVLPASVQNLLNTWTAIFGTTTPTSTSTIPSSSVPALQASITAPNMVVDPGFENAALWTGSPGAQSTAQAHGGTHSWALTGTGTTAVALHLINDGTGPKTLKSRATDVFQLQAFLYPKVGNVGGGTVALQITYTDSTGHNPVDTITVASKTVPATGSWSSITGTGTVPSGYDTVDPQLVLQSSVPNGDMIYVDDALVREETLAQNILDNLVGIAGGSGVGNSLATLTSDFQSIWTNLFGTTTPGTQILQTSVKNLTTIWNAIFGTTTPTGASQVQQTAVNGLTSIWNAIFGTTTPTGSSTIPQTSVSGLVSALSNAVTTGNWNGLLTALFGTTTVGSTIAVAAVPTGIPALNIANVLGGANLGADLTSVNTVATNSNNWWTQLLSELGINPGTSNGTNIGSAISTAQSTATTASTSASNNATNITNTWSWLFGTTTPTSTSLVPPTKLSNLFGGANLSADLTALSNALFGGTTVGSTIQVGAVPTGIPQTNIANLTTIWNAIFGTTTPTGASTILQTSINGLTTLWNNIFGTTTPTGSTPIQQSAIANLTATWNNLFGIGNSPTSSALATTALPSISIGGTSNTIPAQIQAVVDQIYQSFMGGTSTGNTLASIKANFQQLFSNLFGTTAAGAQIQQNAISGLTNIWNAIFGTTTPTGSSTIPQASVSGLVSALANAVTTGNYNGLLTALFGSTTVGSTIQTTAVPVLTSSKLPIFGISQASGTNLVADPGFENATAWANASAGVQSTVQAHGGTHSWMLQGAGSGSSTILRLINNDVGPTTLASRAGEVFQLQSWVYPKVGNAGGGTIQLALYLTDSTGHNAAQTIYTYWSVPATGAWTFLSAYETVPAGYDTVDPRVNLVSVPTTDYVYVDDVLVREETLAQGLISTLFGGSAIGTTVQPTALPTNVQSANTYWSTLMTTLFGGATPGSTVQATALPTNVQSANTYWSTLMTNLFGGATPASTVQAAALPANVQSANTYWSTLMTNLFGASTPAATVQATALPTNVQSANTYWSTLMSTLFGGTTPASTVQAAALPSTLQTVNSNWSSLLSSLFSGGTIGSTIQVGAVPTGIPQANISNLTSIWNAIFGTTTPTGTSTVQAGALPTNVQSANNYWSTLMTNLFGAPTPATTVQTAALPNIAAGTGPGQSADLQTHMNNWATTVGASGPSALSAAQQAMQLLTNTVNSLSAQVQQNSTSDTGAGNSGQSFQIFFPSYSTWSQVPVNTHYGAGTNPGTTGFGSGQFIIDSNGHAAWNPVSNGDVAAIAIFNGVLPSGTVQAYTDTVYQKLNASLAGLPNGGNARNYAVVRANAINNPSDYVYGVVYLNSSLTGLNYELGCYISGVQHIWATGSVSTINLNFTFVAGVGTNQNRYQGFAGNTLVFDHTNVAGDPGGLFPVDLSHTYWGFRSDTYSNGQAYPAPASYVGCADNAPPTIPGVGLKLYRTGSSVTMGYSSGLQYFTAPSGQFFDAATEGSNGVHQLTTQVGSAFGQYYPTIQVDNAGRYLVGIRSDVYSANTTQGAVSICPVVIRYNSAGTQQEIKYFPTPSLFINGFGGNYNAAFIGGEVGIGCQAGDILQAAYLVSAGPSNGAVTGLLNQLSFIGESTGGHTYFEVLLANWSFN